VSISFGLGFATLLVLLVIPALLSMLESTRARFGKAREPIEPGAAPADELGGGA